VETLEAPPPPRRWRRIRTPNRPAWLLRVLVESFSIVLSILVALAVDNWRDNRNNHQLAMKSLRIFEREIRQNLSRLEDVSPYHSGLRDVVVQAQADPEHGFDVRSIVEGVRPTVLLNTAWQTALATGALTHIDVETVSALSLTYSIQQRFVDDGRVSYQRLAGSEAPAGAESRAMVSTTSTYLSDLVTAEQQLRGVYEQALQIIDRTLQGQPGEPEPDTLRK